MNEFTIYDEHNGIITQTGKSPLEIEYLSKPGKKAINGKYSQDTYFPDGVKADRPKNPATINKLLMKADTLDSIIIDNIPIGSIAHISGTGIEHRVETITDGKIVFITSQPGYKSIKIECVPYLDQRFYFNAN